MAAVVDRFEFKRLVLKATPRVGSAEESRENSFWRKFKVGGGVVSRERICSFVCSIIGLTLR